MHGALGLPVGDYPLLLLALITLPLIDLTLRGMGFKRFARMLERHPCKTDRERVFPVEPWNHRATIIAIAGRWAPLNGSCLRQAALLWCLLRLRRWPARYCVGVSCEQGFAAHAWVEVAGAPLGQGAAVVERFALLLSR